MPATFTEKERARTPFVRRPDGRLVLQVSDHDLAQAEEERLREDLRLFYVAATRPRHLLWLGLGPIEKTEKILPKRAQRHRLFARRGCARKRCAVAKRPRNPGKILPK